MRYEFEIGDYVKIIANKSCSTHPIGYIGIVKDVNTFYPTDLPGTWYNLGVGIGEWSHHSEVVSATVTEYVAYHTPKIPAFKVGDWVKVKYDATGSSAGRALPGFILKIGSIGDNSNGRGQFIGDYASSNSFVGTHLHGIYFTELVLATDAEIKKHLLAEATKRGFKPGVTYKTSISSQNVAHTNPELYGNMNSKFNLHCGYGCGLIYNDATNEWATIIPGEKKLCGHLIEQPRSSSYIKIGCKTISKGEAKTFLDVCDKFDITKVMSGYIKDKSITLDAIKEALK